MTSELADGTINTAHTDADAQMAAEASVAEGANGRPKFEIATPLKFAFLMRAFTTLQPIAGTKNRQRRNSYYSKLIQFDDTFKTMQFNWDTHSGTASQKFRRQAGV